MADEDPDMVDIDFDNLPAGILEAQAVVVGACECPQVHIVFYDAQGHVFARGVMTPEEFARSAADVAEYVAEVRADQGDTIGDVKGSA